MDGTPITDNMNLVITVTPRPGFTFRTPVTNQDLLRDFEVKIDTFDLPANAPYSAYQAAQLLYSDPIEELPFLSSNTLFTNLATQLPPEPITVPTPIGTVITNRDTTIKDPKTFFEISSMPEPVVRKPHQQHLLVLFGLMLVWDRHGGRSMYAKRTQWLA